MTGVLDHVNLHLVDSSEKVADFTSWLGRKRDILGVDTETGGFNPFQCRLRMVQFGDTNDGWAIPWDRWGGLAVEALNRYEGLVVMHNSPFDVKFLKHHAGKDLKRWKWERTHDTLTMAHLLDPQRPKGLKPLAAIHIDQKAATAQSMLSEAMVDNKWTWDTVPIDFPLYWVYGAMDPVLTCHIWSKFIDRIGQRAYGLELGTLRVVTEMMLKGARVDLTYCHQKQQSLMDWVNEATIWLQQSYGLTNPTSNQQVIEALVQAGVELPNKRTPTGNQSLDKEVLMQINHPIAQYVLLIRKAEKNVGPYFRHFIMDADADDRVHPTIWTLGTRTARMSITDPALQTLPRKDPTVRNAFVPTPGNALVTSDFDQIEARLMAHFSRDPGMCAAFMGEDDFFVSLARQIFNDPSLGRSDARRQLTKNTVYGKLYGAGVEKMAETAGVALDQMATVVNAFETTFPGVKVFQRAVNDKALERSRTEGVPYIMTPEGRKLVADDSKEYTLVNYLIQSHAAEIFKRKLLELDAVGLGEYMILPVHDEIVMDVPAEDAEDVAVEVERTMRDDANYLIPITASAEVIPTRWGAKYE